jgi:hypothetical protein
MESWSLSRESRLSFDGAHPTNRSGWRWAFFAATAAVHGFRPIGK